MIKICEKCESSYCCVTSIKKRRYCSVDCARAAIATSVKEVQCTQCGVVFFVKKRSHTTLCSVICKRIHYKITHTQDITCSTCSNIVQTTFKRRKYCNDCVKLAQRRGSLNSVLKQATQRRSTNEIIFADLCLKQFQNVTTNDQFFNGWDADVLLHDLKVAVLWNGPWHHRKLKLQHSVAQVQNRDKLKQREIRAKDWVPYVINDYRGKKNDVAFVKSEFDKFTIWVGTVVEGVL